VNVYSQELEVYDSGFSKSLFTLVEAKEKKLFDEADSKV
jgi:hypothetical protein